jgi:cell fate regulator YaaT (PSP1 superfamily)
MPARGPDRRRTGPPAEAGRQTPPEPATEPAPDPAEAGPSVVVVRFKGHRKDYYHNRAGLPLTPGQHCVVEADRGRDLGQVSYCGPGRPGWWERAGRQGVLALASADDLARLPDLRREEREARGVALRKIADHGLPMQLVGIERRWDRGKLTFYFLADGRVDFRALVRDLAGVFRTRIELRQIGVRDEARLKGGLGICGREFCCASFLSGFASVALRMAKDQQLPLNPAKLSGPCGRLRCCLAYEHAQYRESLASLPRPNSAVIWQGRPGRARKLDPLHGTVVVQLQDQGHETVEVPAGELDFERRAAGTADPGESDRPGEGRAASGAGDPANDRRRRRPRRRGGRRRGGRKGPRQ